MVLLIWFHRVKVKALTVRLRDVRPQGVVLPVDDVLDLLVVANQLQVDNRSLISGKISSIINFFRKEVFLGGEGFFHLPLILLSFWKTIISSLTSSCLVLEHPVHDMN